jgi:hypothetical protein
MPFPNSSAVIRSEREVRGERLTLRFRVRCDVPVADLACQIFAASPRALAIYLGVDGATRCTSGIGRESRRYLLVRPPRASAGSLPALRGGPESRKFA